MSSSNAMSKALEWKELIELADKEDNRTEGPTNAQSILRLFGEKENNVRVTLYRDHHAWCPYCQKVWLWLEWKQIPYRVRKVTMRCYGEKESWYTKKVPSGILPAIEIDNVLFTESDLILEALQTVFGPLGSKIDNQETLKLRNLERQIFMAWCQWLCTPFLNNKNQQRYRENFYLIARKLDLYLSSNRCKWLDPVQNSKNSPLPGTADVVFIPYLERMNASLAYYKGFSLRDQFPAINQWLTSLESLEVYRGTQGDMHTHAHDLPPQMGGCWVDPTPTQKDFANAIDSGQGLGTKEICWSYPERSTKNHAVQIALARVIKHQETLNKLNPLGPIRFDQPLRAALTKMVLGIPIQPEHRSAKGLRYLRDRISVPRDMPVLAARELRQALESTAAIDGDSQGIKIPFKNRFDQNPAPFINGQT